MTSIKQIQLRSFWLFLALILIAGFWLGLKFFKHDQNRQSATESYTSLNTSKESCTQCHEEMTGFSSFHDPQLIGCVVCHLGNATTTDKDLSHQDMVVIPGNLSDAEFTF